LICTNCNLKHDWSILLVITSNIIGPHLIDFLIEQLNDQSKLLCSCVLPLKAYLTRNCFLAVFGPGSAPPMDPPEYVIQQTIAQINAAPNENAAIQAALPAFNPLLDTADAVKSALETRVRQFRAVNFPRYTPGMPLPNLPNHWDAHDVMAAAYWGANAPAAVGATPNTTCPRSCR